MQTRLALGYLSVTIYGDCFTSNNDTITILSNGTYQFYYGISSNVPMQVHCTVNGTALSLIQFLGESPYIEADQCQLLPTAHCKSREMGSGPVSNLGNILRFQWKNSTSAHSGDKNSVILLECVSSCCCKRRWDRIDSKRNPILYSFSVVVTLSAICTVPLRRSGSLIY